MKNGWTVKSVLEVTLVSMVVAAMGFGVVKLGVFLWRLLFGVIFH